VDGDEAVRTACFLALDVLRAEFGEDVPYRGGLDRGFAYSGTRVPFINYQKGIYRARVQRGPAALSINTSWNSPYDDVQTDLGFLMRTAPARSTSRTTAHSARPVTSGCRSCTSSEPDRAGISRCIRAWFETAA
jgi:hypothetical protein